MLALLEVFLQKLRQNCQGHIVLSEGHTLIHLLDIQNTHIERSDWVTIEGTETQQEMPHVNRRNMTS